MRPPVSHCIVTTLAADKDVTLAFLYGSHVKGTASAISDVDVAVAARRPLSLDRRLALAAALEAGLGRAVDLLDLQAAHGTTLHEALVGGQLLLNRDPLVYAVVLKRFWYQEADMMPQYRAALAYRRRRFIDGPSRP